MKSLMPLALIIAGMLAAGCLHHRPARSTAPAAAGSQPIVTPDNSLTARVVSYNASGRFVVLSFPIGQMPKLDQDLFLYREGMKVGEVKITGPQRENNIVADLVTGEAQMGDEVRDQ
ncbi:MAG: hypothetical protein ABSF60_07685 [Verrucomicrobiota bacterium]|jgi:hypothetical protein